ncbi:hypothetical protein Pmani_021258 [Petrolisthes manimaculis]|uniref:Uncharacterized protein n=1 Tax=Petrolisthes manimaculis TaxID=1843537 RepID=A0AAE1U5H1_9EUCA|nr:hypothetical protein Pmani_021258 [Petrolisthes manimaculis]
MHPPPLPATVASRRQEAGAGGTGDEVNGCELSELHVTTPAPPRPHDTLCPLHLGSRADLLERRGVADVSTIYDEMVATSPDPASVPPITSTHPQETVNNGNNALANAYESTHATQAHVEPVHAHVESQQHAHAPQYIHQHAHHHHPHPHHLPHHPPPPPQQHQDYPASPPPPMTPTSILPDMHHSVSYHHLPTSPLTVPPPPDMRVVMPMRGGGGGGGGIVDPAAMLMKSNIPQQQQQQQQLQQQLQQQQHPYMTTTLPSDSIISSIPSSIPATVMYTHAHVMPPPVSHTMTLPHPRSSHARGHVAHAATLQRRSSLYMVSLLKLFN